MKRKIHYSITIGILIVLMLIASTVHNSYAFWTGADGSFSNSGQSKGSFIIGGWQQATQENILIETPIINPSNPIQSTELINNGYFYPQDYNFSSNAWFKVSAGYIFSRVVDGKVRYYQTTYDMDYGTLSNQYNTQAFLYLNFQIEFEQYARLEGNRIYVYQGNVFLRTTMSDSWITIPDVSNPYQGYTYYSENNLVYSSTKTYKLYEPVRYDGKLYQVTDATLANKNLPTQPKSGWKQVDNPQWSSSNTYVAGDMVLVDEKIYQVIDLAKANQNTPGTVNSGWKRLDTIYWVEHNSYSVNEIVIMLGQYYKSKISNNNSQVSDTSAWEKINYRVWDPNVVYQLGEVIYYNKLKYVSLKNNNQASLSDTSSWASYVV